MALLINPQFRYLSLCLCSLLLLDGCAGQPYVSTDVSTGPFLARKITQKQEAIRVSAAVPDASETAELFGLSLYEKGVQPVWIEVENNSVDLLRLSIWSVDSDYYSPLEVAWMNRKGYSGEGQAAMERSLYDAAIDRRIPPGEKSSGFVFTHLKPGTKGFNVDLISDQLRSYTFTFFVPMPGFVADYMAVDFERLYDDDEIVELDLDTLRPALEQAEYYASDVSGTLQGLPLNVAIVGTPVALRRALLRANWQETELRSSIVGAAREQHYADRPPDSTFMKTRADGTERKVLNLWLTPMRVGQEPVWLGQTVTAVGVSGKEGENLLVSADVDTPYIYLMQNFWYSQSLTRIGFVRAGEAVSSAAPIETFGGRRYYSNGMRGVLWLSEDPVGLDEVQNLNWEPMTRD
jgi:LssY C-terminus